MKIIKITDKINLNNKKGIELQGCYNDCTEYKQKTKSIYSQIRRAGYKADGNDGVETIREIKQIFGDYCYKMNTAKTNLYW